MLSVWCGANRFEHTEVTRHDPVLKRVFKFERMANFKAIMRLFARFSQGSNEAVMDSLYRWMRVLSFVRSASTGSRSIQTPR